jgi:hypothetical protein
VCDGKAIELALLDVAGNGIGAGRCGRGLRRLRPRPHLAGTALCQLAAADFVLPRHGASDAVPPQFRKP